ncbi:MAG: hypothetical protein AB8F95_06550 [Bacteroidia bacterium]
MKDHKLIELFKSFDKATSKKFLHFIQSSYPGYSQKIVSLANFLMSFYPEFEAEDLTETGVFESIGLNKSFSKHELIRYLSNLLSAVEDFIAIETLLNFQYAKGAFVADYYYKTQNEGRLSKVLKQNEKKLEHATTVDSTNYFYTYLNEKLAHNYSRQKWELNKANLHLDHALTAINHYYYIEVLQAVISFYHQNKKQPDRDEIPLLTPMLEYLEQNKENLPPLIKLWLLSYKLTQQPESVEIYSALKLNLLRHLRITPPVDAHNFTIILNNALTQQLSKGRKRYVEELFDIYQIEIQEGWLSANDIMAHNIFTNIIVISLVLGKIQYASSFLEKYQHQLIPEVRENIVTYNKSRIAFAQDDYRACLILTQQIDYFDHSVTLGIKRLQTMCYFELGDLKGLFNSLNALKMFLYRTEKLRDSLKTRNNHFYKIVSLLSKNADRVPEEKVKQSIQEIIDDNPLLPELEWIEKKLK